MDANELSEEWRLIQDFPDYEVSSLGRVRRAKDGYRTHPISGTVYLRYRAGTIINGGADLDGYRGVTLHREGYCRRIKICVLVCLAFNGPRPSPEYQVAHWDGCNTNDRKDNLRWATAAQNAADRDRHGMTRRGERHSNSVLTDMEVLEIKQRLREGGWGTGRQLAREFGVCESMISHIRVGRMWKHL